MKDEIGSLRLIVNGNELDYDGDPETPLLTVLRNELGLKGAKLGCGQEQCFACAVLVDGAAVPSCHLPVSQVANIPVVTLEGLGTPENLHPLQEVFIETGAAQCGYCTAGMIVSAQGLLNRVRYPTDAQIKEGLSTNLCRCGVYERVRRAIKMRIGHLDPDDTPYELIEAAPLGEEAPVQEMPLSSSFRLNPQLDGWLRINQDHTVSILTGKVELGQGIKTALRQIAAEELDVDLERVELLPVDTDFAPNEGKTAGSMTLQLSGVALRQASADARYHMLQLAFEELDAQVPATELQVVDGTISDPVGGKSTTYWTLMGGRPFEQEVSGIGRPKAAAEHTVVGAAQYQPGIVNKTTGRPHFLHDLDLPDMVYARVIRPANYRAKLVKADVDTLKREPGVLAVVRDGSFLAVVAETEAEADLATDKIATQIEWELPEILPPAVEPSAEGIQAHLQQGAAHSFPVINGSAVDQPLPDRPPSYQFNAVYSRPYQMHGALGPAAAAAVMRDDKLKLWVQTQGVFPIRERVAKVLKLPVDSVSAEHIEGAGSYGRSGADDAALDVALIAYRLRDQLNGRPIMLNWSRADEHGWEPFAPAMRISLSANLTSNEDEIARWRHEVWSYPHIDREDEASSNLIAARFLADSLPEKPGVPILARHVGEYRNADPLYIFKSRDDREIISHLIPDSPLRVATFRSLGTHGNTFAIESFMDELAYASGLDPVHFRLKHLQDERAVAVINATARKAGWEPGNLSQRKGHGRGFAFSQYKNIQIYVALVVDLEVDLASGEVRLEKVTIGADAGQVVNPDGLSNQLEGGFVQAASMTLYESVGFDRHGVTSLDWDSYPIMRFDNVPKIETVIINRPDQPFLGAGEGLAGPTPAAIANAIFAATGARLRHIPFRPAQVLAGGQ